MGVGVCRDGWPNVEAWGVILEVGVKEVGIDSVDDVAANEERICVCSGESALDFVGGKFFYDALHDNRQEVSAGTLA